MENKLEIRSLAAIEIVEAYDWYELQREGLGMEFMGELEAFFNIVLKNPDTYSYYEKPIRQGKVNRFPFTVVYETFNNIIVVYSVFMFRQHPGKKRTI